MQLYRRLARVQSDTHLVFWLRQVTLRLAIDRLRREATHRVVPLEEGLNVAAEPSESDPLLQRRLHALVAQLPAAARAVVLLRYQEDLDPIDIAATLDLGRIEIKSGNPQGSFDPLNRAYSLAVQVDNQEQRLQH